MPDAEEYARGLRDGEVQALQKTVGGLQVRLDKHETRITAQERITYGLLAIIAFIEFMPAIQALAGN